MFHNTNKTKYNKKFKIQTRQNTKEQNTNCQKYYCNKIQMKQNTNGTKYKQAGAELGQAQPEMGIEAGV